jgi:predicted HAD superfamily Cof-like phosphohydrolase
MTNPFKDQEQFMRACDQAVPSNQHEVTDPLGIQFDLYLKLIKEEYHELLEAQGLDADHNRVKDADPEETLDALIDILVVTIGAIHSMGADGEGAWNEVMRTNLAKIDPTTGKVRKREDGKVLKPEGWKPPDLKPYLK